MLYKCAESRQAEKPLCLAFHTSHALSWISGDSFHYCQYIFKHTYVALGADFAVMDPEECMEPTWILSRTAVGLNEGRYAGSQFTVLRKCDSV